MSVIIDGYNLLRAIQQFEQYESITDIEMCRVVSMYLKRIQKHGEIVFDGIGPPNRAPFHGLANLDVWFSGPQTEADDIIENILYHDSAPKRLVVVSTDRRVRDAARKRKANSMRADDFWDHLAITLEKPHRPSPEPPAKTQGISPSETKQWLDLFFDDK